MSCIYLLLLFFCLPSFSHNDYACLLLGYGPGKYIKHKDENKKHRVPQFRNKHIQYVSCFLFFLVLLEL